MDKGMIMVSFISSFLLFREQECLKKTGKQKKDSEIRKILSNN